MSFRKITVKSGDEEFTLEVTEEEYLKYYRPWWQQKKHEQRNREAMSRTAIRKNPMRRGGTMPRREQEDTGFPQG